MATSGRMQVEVPEQERFMLKRRKNIHEETELLLPWLVNGSLSDKEYERVVEHLIGCESCRESRDRLQSLQTLISEEDDSSRNYKPAFSALQRRIGAAERDKRVLADFDFQKNSWFSQVKQGESRFHPGIQSVVVVATLILGVMVVSPELTEPAITKVPDTYKTLTSETTRDVKNYHRALITFAPDVASEQIREILVSTNAKIVRGSYTNGNLVVDLEIPASLSKEEFFDQIRYLDAVTSVVSVAN